VVTPLLALPDGTVLDGELLVVTTAGPQPFQQLQQRLQRRAPSASIQRRLPVRFRAYDVLEWQGEDLRATPLRQRRKVLDAVVANTPALDVSDVIDAPTWADAAAHRERAAQHGVEGLMLKRLESPYHTGRKRGDWWKWKVEPYVLDAVLLYAQAGHGRRASLFTDYTFGLWSDGELVTFAKAYSGLSDAEIRTLDGWIKANTIERFGPVRSVPRTQVFEIAFEGIARSTRHKAGVAVRFPRIKRWRTDKPATEADTLDALVALLDARNA
jgi:DNA ligase-1